MRGAEEISKTNESPSEGDGRSELWEHWEARVAVETKTAGGGAPGKTGDQQTRGAESQQEVHSLQEQLQGFERERGLELPNMKDNMGERRCGGKKLTDWRRSLTCTGGSAPPGNDPKLP